MRVWITICLGLFLVVIGAAAALSEVPQLISCQGILADAEGEPITATVNVIFTIYDGESNGNVEWTATRSVTPDIGGRFDILLGESEPIGDTVFAGPDRWLGIQVEGYSEMAPRLRLVSTAYAYQVSTVDGASGGQISGELTVDGQVGIGLTEPTEALEVAGTVYSNSGGFRFPDGSLQTTATIGGDDSKWSIADSVLYTKNYWGIARGGAENTLYGDSLFTMVNLGVACTTGTNGENYGGATVSGGIGNIAGGPVAAIGGGRYNLATGEGATVAGGIQNIAAGDYSFAAGRRAVANHDGVFVWADSEDADLESTRENQFLIRAAGGLEVESTAGDSSVILPDSAISADEVLDEPGIAQGILKSGSVTVTDSTSMFDIVTVTINIPAAGYIVVEATAMAWLFGAAAENAMVCQIDETEGGQQDENYYYLVGLGDPSPDIMYLPVTMRRTYFKDVAGSYQFRFEAKDATTGGGKRFSNPVITAIYFPTSYGPVNAFVSSAEASEFENAEAVTMNGQAHAGSASSESAYLVDLRELELKAARAQAEAERANRELLDAKVQQR